MALTIDNFLYQQQLAIFVFLCVLFNVLTIKPLSSSPIQPASPLVSVLVPARNEAQNIGGCLNSLLNQDYEPYEVIALDDESQAATPEILYQLSQGDSRLKVLSGQ